MRALARVQLSGGIVCGLLPLVVLLLSESSPKTNAPEPPTPQLPLLVLIIADASHQQDSDLPFRTFQRALALAAAPCGPAKTRNASATVVVLEAGAEHLATQLRVLQTTSCVASVQARSLGPMLHDAGAVARRRSAAFFAAVGALASQGDSGETDTTAAAGALARRAQLNEDTAAWLLGVPLAYRSLVVLDAGAAVPCQSGWLATLLVAADSDFSDGLWLRLAPRPVLDQTELRVLESLEAAGSSTRARWPFNWAVPLSVSLSGSLIHLAQLDAPAGALRTTLRGLLRDAELLCSQDPSQVAELSIWTGNAPVPPELCLSATLYDAEGWARLQDIAHLVQHSSLLRQGLHRAIWGEPDSAPPLCMAL
eukprot:m.313029 g.313029  ORF g.313029 m.313029 type:complete len:367 (+) comp32220_c0_seq1:101-1201(+)